MCAELTPLSHIAIRPLANHFIAVHNGKGIVHSDFISDIRTATAYFSSLYSKDIAIYYQDAYPFTVALYAILHNGKNVWIAGNNKTATANKLKKQGCSLVGEWPDNKPAIKPSIQPSSPLLSPLNLDQVQLIIFTSGSQGEPKAIKKTLRQFQNEIEFLEQQWGQRLAQAQVFSTVSHQHIYGLIFRILWPLAAKRCFHSSLFVSPEALLKAAGTTKVYWVASPAQLKRLDEQTAWQDITNLRAIFSSGGTLPEDAAWQIYEKTQHKIIEVYGSSETGGIAWRQSVDDSLWTLFAGLTLIADVEGNMQLASPFLQVPTLKLDDKIELYGKEQFSLLGRSDRIVKVEEKRLSLDELEQCLNQSEWIEHSYTLLLKQKNREITSAVLVLTEKGKCFLDQHGKAELLKQLRQQLMSTFETLVLPKKCLCIQQIPLTVQDKIDKTLLTALLTLDATRFPLIQYCEMQNNQVVLQCKVPASLLYFKGHFPEHPILPGITQLAWVEHFGKLFFNIKQPFLRMEVIKFKKIIRPNSFIQMELNWKTESGKLYFSLRSSKDLFSSGRMVFGTH